MYFCINSDLGVQETKHFCQILLIIEIDTLHFTKYMQMRDFI